MTDTKERIRNIANIVKNTSALKLEITIYPKEEPPHRNTVRIGYQRVSFIFGEEEV